MFTSILGIVVVLVEISVKDNFERKKYMGVHRFESELTASMIRRFPMTVTRYVDKNKLKMTGVGLDHLPVPGEGILKYLTGLWVPCCW
jgi:hypothetical protein